VAEHEEALAEALAGLAHKEAALTQLRARHSEHREEQGLEMRGLKQERAELLEDKEEATVKLSGMTARCEAMEAQVITK
jgi:transcription initiation factor TFIID subunit TAF12